MLSVHRVMFFTARLLPPLCIRSTGIINLIVYVEKLHPNPF